jgi:hypothetical protein
MKRPGLTLMPVAWAIEGDGGFAMFMAASAVAAAGGAACTSVGDRSMRNYLKFEPPQTKNTFLWAPLQGHRPCHHLRPYLRSSFQSR